MTYFLVLGVIGVVSQIANVGSAMAKGETASTNIAFNLDNLLFRPSCLDKQLLMRLEAA